jgi:hypothetical protein
MLNRLTIKSFKSIKELNIDCSRINLFIGEPNAGKSNILEALGLLSFIGNQEYGNMSLHLHNYIRYKYFYNLFNDNILDVPIEISGLLDNINFELKSYQKDSNIILKAKTREVDIDTITANFNELYGFNRVKEFCSIKYYKYMPIDNFDDITGSPLTTPAGSNLYTVLATNPDIRNSIKIFFKNFGYRLRLKTVERQIEAQREVGDMDFDYPISLLSDTLRRIMFYFVAIESNKGSSLIFEEPESHSFPYYTKLLGEKIGRDINNQYFIATHNPYLIKSVLEKANTGEADVYVTHFKDYQTNIVKLNEEQLSEFMEMDIDIFLNLRKYY